MLFVKLFSRIPSNLTVMDIRQISRLSRCGPFIFHKLHISFNSLVREREREVSVPAGPKHADTDGLEKQEKRDRNEKGKEKEPATTRPLRGCSSVWRQSASEN